MIQPIMTQDDVDEIQQHMATVKINNTGGELERLQEKQRAAIERQISRGKDPERDLYASPPSSAGVHPDLQELSFGELGSSHG